MNVITSDIVLFNFIPDLSSILATDASPWRVISHQFPDVSEKPIELGCRSLPERLPYL